jgi:hypothetical protein
MNGMIKVGVVTFGGIENWSRQACGGGLWQTLLVVEAGKMTRL